MAYTLWLFKNSLSLSVQYCPMWRRGGLFFHENGGRQASECLDMTLVIHKLNLNVTVWGLRWLSAITRWIPTGQRGGFAFGIAPVGAGETDGS